MRFLYEIKLFNIVDRNWIKSTSLCHIRCLFAGLKFLGRFLYKWGTAKCFFSKNIKIVCFVFVNLCRCLRENQLHVMSKRSLLVVLAMIMTTTSHLIPTKKRHLRHIHQLTTLPRQVQRCNIEGVPSQLDPFTHMYEAQWKDELSM